MPAKFICTSRWGMVEILKFLLYAVKMVFTSS